MNFKEVIVQSFGLLSRSDKKKILLVSIFQTLMSLLDLIGVALFGLLGAIAVTGVQSTENSPRINSLLQKLGIIDLSLQAQSALIALTAVFILIIRTIISVAITKKTLRYLSNRGAYISNKLISDLLHSGFWNLKNKSIQEIIFSTSYGVRVILLGIVGNIVTLTADISLLVVMSIGLVVINWQVTLASMLGFVLVASALYANLHRKSASLGEAESRLDISINSQVTQSIKSYRELFVKDRINFYISDISEKRYKNASILAEISFMPLISKYVIETSVLLGVLVITMMQFLVTDAKGAVATLAVFMAAGTRIAPAVLRAQLGLLQLKTNSGAAAPTFELRKELRNVNHEKPSSGIDTEIDSQAQAIEFKNAFYRFPDSEEDVLSNVTFSVRAGQSLAIVGPSGAGKSTLVDLMLGIIKPTSGSVGILGISPDLAIKMWPMRIGYVPQDVEISSGSIRSNIELGYSPGTFSEAQILEALRKCELEKFVLGLENGIETNIGENGSKLSGGQKQRLGIARAMIGNPDFLILDEATSALDAETEESITRSISSLRGHVTVVSIAHRLSTIKNADLLLYLENGKLLQKGSFEHIRASVPNFEKQASILGIEK